MHPTSPESGVEPFWALYKRHWVFMVTVAGACVVLAIIAALLRPPIYQAEARLAVGQGQMTALNIPGFPSASEEMASNYARWVTHQGVQGQGIPDGVLSLEASPIVESNVLRIEATSLDPETAESAVAKATKQLKDAVNAVREENNPANLVAQYQDGVRGVLEARERVDRRTLAYQEARDGGKTKTAARRFDELVEAQRKLAGLEMVQDGKRDRYRNLQATRSTEAELVDVHAAQIESNDRMAVVQRNAFLALIIGLLLGAGIVRVRETRSNKKARNGSQVDVETQARGQSRVIEG